MGQIVKKWKAIPLGEKRHAGAMVGADLYNSLILYADCMDVDLSWVVRRAFEEFIVNHQEALARDPLQLALDLRETKP